MTKKKSIVSKLLLLVLLLTLVSCCFLGSTFARYTSGGGGSATVSVADWNISIGEGEFKIAFADDLSPLAKEYPATAGDSYQAESARKNSTEIVKVATIKNTGDVDALVTLTADNASIVYYFEGTEEGNKVTFDEQGSSDPYKPSQAQMAGVFTIVLCDADGTPLENPFTLDATDGSKDIYAQITWTSDIAGCFGAAADARDTWIAQNIDTIAFAISYTAVQSTDLPA